MKKIYYVLLVVAVAVLFTGCQSKEKNLTGSLKEIMKEVYSGIPSDELPATAEIEVTKENQEYYLGKISFDYEEALASEPLMSSIAHSVVLVRVKDTKDIDAKVAEIKEKVDPRKWICVEVEEQNVVVVNNGNVIMLAMENNLSAKFKENFLNLK